LRVEVTRDGEDAVFGNEVLLVVVEEVLAGEGRESFLGAEFGEAVAAVAKERLAGGAEGEFEGVEGVFFDGGEGAFAALVEVFLREGGVEEDVAGEGEEFVEVVA